jgi:uncharacterized protein (DUF433 family)
MPITQDQLQPYISEELDEGQITTLIERHVDAAPDRYGVADARIRGAGVRVATVIADLDGLDDTIDDAAESYSVRPEDVFAAVHFYWRNQKVIDAVITVRRSWFET